MANFNSPEEIKAANNFAQTYVSWNFNNSKTCKALHMNEATGRNWLKTDLVQDEIARIVAEGLKKHKITTDTVLDELANIAFFDPIELYDTNGKVRKMQDIPASTRRCISSMKVKESPGDLGYTKEVKTYDSLKALELLGKNLGAFKEIVKVEDERPKKRVQTKDLKQRIRHIKDLKQEGKSYKHISKKLENIKEMNDHNRPLTKGMIDALQ